MTKPLFEVLNCSYEADEWNEFFVCEHQLPSIEGTQWYAAVFRNERSNTPPFFLAVRCVPAEIPEAVKEEAIKAWQEISAHYELEQELLES